MIRRSILIQSTAADHCIGKMYKGASLNRQLGQVAILTVVLIALGVGAAVFAFVGNQIPVATRMKDQGTAMLQVKSALIGYAVSGDTATQWRPGELPCPDTDNDGYQETTCAAGALGRVPWKTLNIPEPKGTYQETLWYAVSSNFYHKGSGGTPNVINSDTVGNLSVYQNSTSGASTPAGSLLTSRAAAVIFAPGETLSTQDRTSSTSALCTTTNTTIARNLCAVNYLDAITGTGAINNAALNPTSFVRTTYSSSTTFNDTLIYITSDELIPIVEKRVVTVLLTLLKAYKTATGVYPYADVSDGVANVGYNRSRFACNAAGALPTAWGNGGTPTLPTWFSYGCSNPQTGWTGTILVTAGANALASCTQSCSASLRLDGVFGTSLLIITPGAKPSGNGRTTATFPSSGGNGYFADATNAGGDDTYVTPSGTANKLYKCPDATNPNAIC